MVIFPHWRAVGRAMLQARRREGVTVERDNKIVGCVLMRYHTYRGPADALVVVKHFEQSTTFDTYSGVTGSANVYPNSAAEALRLLAALDLIPAHLAEGPDERYGRCVKCGRLTRRWDDFGTTRWVHVIGGAERFADYPYHPAEVAS
jgi:hypothetical protein